MSGEYPSSQHPFPQHPSSLSQQPTDAVPRRSRGSFDAGRLWSGAAAASVVASLVAIVGVLVTDGIFGLELITPSGHSLATGWLVSVAVLGTLGATGLMHLLLVYSPQPLLFFGWIAALVGIVLVLSPYVHDAPVGTQVASSLVYLFLALAVGSLVTGLADSAIRTRRPRT